VAVMTSGPLSERPVAATAAAVPISAMTAAMAARSTQPEVGPAVPPGPDVGRRTPHSKQ